jgi:hypothetical protein
VTVTILLLNVFLFDVFFLRLFFRAAYKVFSQRCGYVEIGLLGCSNAVSRCQIFVEIYCHHLQPWRWRQIPSVPIFKAEVGDSMFLRKKRWYLPTSPHGVTTQEANIDVFTAVKTLNLTTMWRCVLYLLLVCWKFLGWCIPLSQDPCLRGAIQKNAGNVDIIHALSGIQTLIPIFERSSRSYGHCFQLSTRNVIWR